MADAHGTSGAQPIDVGVSSTLVDDSNADADMHGEASATGQDSPHERGETVLYGQSLACLHVDNTERLSLAQISNTLLRRFRYNDIHNRRVALGITCAQCTPGQLEVFRRAGAMPAASRRCGIITKREAERLVKSFVEDSHPPKLPADFVFSVRHSCGWGCVGCFMPARYNSSRAKCIKCGYCDAFFSPNKFLFHFHRSPDSVYRHPDAANFNSWRRHLTLAAEQPTEALVHMWEDVKATFNSGNRKALVHTTPSNPASPRSTAVSPPFTSFKSPDTSRVPFAVPPLSTVIPPASPSAFPLGMPPEQANTWLDHRRVGPNPFGLLFTRHFYSSLIQPSAFRLPLLALHNNAYASAATPKLGSRPTLPRHHDLEQDVSLHSAFQSVNAEHSDAADEDASRFSSLSKLA